MYKAILSKLFLSGALLVLACLSPCSGNCADCAFDNGIGFTNTSDCTQYLQCQELAPGQYTSTVIQCPSGLFWDQQSLTCNFPASVTCDEDPCLVGGTTSYNINCRQYYFCNERDIPASCCPDGQAFNSTTGQCEADATCMDSCSSSNVTQDCFNRRPVAGNAAVYEENVFGNWIKRPCPGGTSYEQSTCTCSGPPVAVSTCQPTVRLDFDSPSVRDVSGNNIWVQNSGVTVNGNEAVFDGNSFLRIPRFSNTPLTPHFEIRVTYRAVSDNVNGIQALVTNSDCGKPGSVEISVGDDSSNLTMISASGDAQEINFDLSNQSEQHTIIYKYRNQLFTGILNGTETRNIPNVGEIGKSECAIQIGRGENLNNFNGFIDLLEIYNCETLPSVG